MSASPTSGWWARVGLPFASTRVAAVCLALTIGVAGMLDIIVANANYRTIDEPDHVEYGLQILRGQPDRTKDYFDSKTPITALNAIPQFTADHIEGRGASPRLVELLRSWKLARVPSLLALLLLNVLVCLWAYELFGAAAGVAAAIIVVASPNLIAHGTLATTDGYFALGVVGSLFVFRRYLLHPTVSNACLSGFALALAQLTKPLALYLYLIVGVFLLVAVLGKPRTSPRLTLRALLIYTAISAVLFLVVINVAYDFDRSFTPLQAYHFESTSFIHLQQMARGVPILRDLRVPAPYPFLQGLDMVKFAEATGNNVANIYLLGEVRDPADPLFHGFKSYYAVALFFKEPIALQILVIWGLFWIFKHRTWQDARRGEGLLLAAGGVLVLWLSFFDKAQIGIRHIQPALAINVVVAAAAFANFAVLSRPRQLALGFLLLWLCLSTASYYPQLIPYMNEWVVDRRFEYKILGDSNLDFGQNRYLVYDFLKKNPDVVFNPVRPTCGRLLISTNHLLGIWPRGTKALDWALRERPVAHIGYADLLYVIPANAFAPADTNRCDATSSSR